MSERHATQTTALFACGHAFSVDRQSFGSPSCPKTELKPVSTIAELAEMALQVQLAEENPLFRLDLGQFGAYVYDADKSQVQVYRPALSPEFEELALRGPILLHALAHHGIYVLHASAVQRADGPVFAISAASGVGKSTLAKWAITQQWRRIADDLLPLGHDAQGRLVCLPQLEQPKLSTAEQYPQDAPTLPLAGLVQLTRGTCSSVRRLSAIETLHFVLSNTVATRVYCKPSLVAHLKFAGDLAEQVQSGRLVAAQLTIADRPGNPSSAAAEAIELLSDL